MIGSSVLLLTSKMWFILYFIHPEKKTFCFCFYKLFIFFFVCFCFIATFGNIQSARCCWEVKREREKVSSNTWTPLDGALNSGACDTSSSSHLRGGAEHTGASWEGSLYSSSQTSICCVLVLVYAVLFFCFFFQQGLNYRHLCDQYLNRIDYLRSHHGQQTSHQ